MHVRNQSLSEGFSAMFKLPCSLIVASALCSFALTSCDKKDSEKKEMTKKTRRKKGRAFLDRDQWVEPLSMWTRNQLSPLCISQLFL